MSSLSTQFEMPGSKPHYNPDLNFRTQHIFLDLVLDFENKILYGVSNLTIKASRLGLKNLKLDAVNLDIFGIELSQGSSKWSPVYHVQDRQTSIELPSDLDQNKEFIVKTFYKTEDPDFGITFVGPDEHYPDKPLQVWTQGESEGSRYWYPCLDFPKQIATSEVRVAIPENMTAVSNGLEIDSKKADKQSEAFKFVDQKTLGIVDQVGYKTSHWKQDRPHANYLIMLSAGEFVEIKDTYKDIPVTYYTGVTNQDLLQLTGQKTPRMIEFYANYFGVEYPWQKYAQVWVNDFIWGGMENTSATINTHRALADERSLLDYNFPEVLVAHELSHQWFGDLVTIDHWSNLWVKEGAAIYSESLWYQHEYGQEEFDYYRYLEWDEYLSESYKRATEVKIYRHVEDLYDRHSYTKAGTIYHMLRVELGEDNFRQALKDFLQKNKHQNVEGLDLIRSCERVSGKNLKPFLDQYLFTAGHPDFKVEYSWDEEYQTVKLGITQKQFDKDSEHDTLFSLSIPVSFGYLEKIKGDDLEEVEVNGKKIYLDNRQIKLVEPTQNFYLQTANKPDFVIFDKANGYLKEVELELDLEALKNQAKYSPDVISRLFAIRAIVKKNNLKAVNTLEEVYKTEKFWGAREELMNQLSDLNLDQSFELIKLGLKDSDTRVKAAALRSITKFKTEESYQVIKSFVNKSDEGYITESVAIQALAVVAKELGAKKIEETVNSILDILEKKSGWNEIVRSGALKAMSKFDDDKAALETILEYTKDGVQEQLRAMAIMLLGVVSKAQEPAQVAKVLDRCEELLKEKYIHTERSLIMALSGISSPRSASYLRKIATKSLYGRIQRAALEAAEAVQEKLKPGELYKEYDEKVSKIQEENKKLRSQMEDLLNKFEQLEKSNKAQKSEKESKK